MLLEEPEEPDRFVPAGLGGAFCGELVSAFAAEFPGAFAIAASFFGADFGDFTAAVTSTFAADFAEDFAVAADFFPGAAGAAFEADFLDGEAGLVGTRYGFEGAPLVGVRRLMGDLPGRGHALSTAAT